MPGKYLLKHLHIWAVDPLDKVFRSTPRPPRAPRTVKLEAARGEVISGQIAFCTEEAHCGIDTVTVEPLRQANDGMEIPVECRWVGYTYVPVPSGSPESEHLGGVAPEHLDGTAPGLYPDPLYPVYQTQTHPHHFNPDHSAALFPGRTQALWLTVHVPEETPPGEYTGEAQVKVAYYGMIVRVPIRLTVYPAVLPAARTCGMENWFTLASLVRQHECAWFSERFWHLTEAYLRNMAEHRQTHIVVPMYELIDFMAAPDGTLTMDWARFDRFVALACQVGLTALSGNHLATYTYDRRYHCAVHTFRVDGYTVRYELHEGHTRPAQTWLAWFLPRLRDHLAEQGWLDRWWQHLRDEPHGVREDYEAIYQAVRTYAPEFRTIDALHGPIVSACDCWVPTLNSWGENLAFFQSRRQAGDQVWTYVCCGPTGKYANRFIDQLSVLPRLIFWIMARYGATGYLHWGYNWADVPVPEIDTTGFLPAQGPVQSGDVCLVYPGPHGPHDSIRWEMQREGVQDYELLQQLAARNPRKATALAARLIHEFDEYTTQTTAFRAARRALLRALSE
ncbi:MAG: DUF4091 domain-containing protein [Armatimonadota bacterium]